MPGRQQSACPPSRGAASPLSEVAATEASPAALLHGLPQASPTHCPGQRPCARSSVAATVEVMASGEGKAHARDARHLLEASSDRAKGRCPTSRKPGAPQNEAFNHSLEKHHGQIRRRLASGCSGCRAGGRLSLLPLTAWAAGRGRPDGPRTRKGTPLARPRPWSSFPASGGVGARRPWLRVAPHWWPWPARPFLHTGPRRLPSGRPAPARRSR